MVLFVRSLGSGLFGTPITPTTEQTTLHSGDGLGDRGATHTYFPLDTGVSLSVCVTCLFVLFSLFLFCSISLVGLALGSFAPRVGCRNFRHCGTQSPHATNDTTQEEIRQRGGGAVGEGCEYTMCLSPCCSSLFVPLFFWFFRRACHLPFLSLTATTNSTTNREGKRQRETTHNTRGQQIRNTNQRTTTYTYLYAKCTPLPLVAPRFERRVPSIALLVEDSNRIIPHIECTCAI